MKGISTNFKTKGIVALAAATIALVSSSPVLAQEPFQTEYGFNEEASNTSNSISFFVNDADGTSTQLFKNEQFNMHVKLKINTSDFKNYINSSIQKLPNEAYNNYQATVDGLEDLTGQLTVTLTSKNPLSINADEVEQISSVIKPNGVINTDHFELVNNTSDPTGIKLTATIDWGQLLSKYFDVSNSVNIYSFVNQNIDDVIEVEFTTPLMTLKTTPSVPSSNELTANVSYTVNAATVKQTYDVLTNGNTTTEKKGPKELTINAKEWNNALTAKNTLQFVYKKTPSQPSRPQTKPTKPSNPDNDSSDVVRINRLYNPNTGEHLFTPNNAEATNLMSLGWKYEENDWDTPKTSDSPIYRLYNPNNGDHHYTTSWGETDHLAQVGWRYEGISLYSADAESGVPVYRMYNPNADQAGSHHYTSSTKECEALRNLGWQFEGVAWYGIFR